MKKTDFQLIYDNLTYGLAKYCRENKVKTMVLGISGGIDSTVTAAIANAACAELRIPLIGVSLPSDTNYSADREAAKNVGLSFCTQFDEYDINGLFKDTNNFLNGITGTISSTKIARGNIKARLRMITLYHIASVTGGIVLDTDNKTEHYTGFFTIHGDEGDIGVLRDLDKTTIFAFAKWLKDDSKIINPDQENAISLSLELKPTDGNGVGSDLEQFRLHSYEDVDAIVNGEKVLYTGNVNKLHDKTWYKRLHRPFYIGIDGEYYDGSGNKFTIN